MHSNMSSGIILVLQYTGQGRQNHVPGCLHVADNAKPQSMLLLQYRGLDPEDAVVVGVLDDRAVT